ncbi:hypothetical protein CN03_03535 [Thalassolituus oleivorans]|uniref:hypothetical protein n=1 Tax=Thalassolituus oleivorans TaxID=187493 RepID=UPI00094931DF|nr:hypothetical protein [Thalassolituus oleivorans]APR66079.1 hypothetical protein CN03_03535 [Thalassolituus oleivorans]
MFIKLNFNSHDKIAVKMLEDYVKRSFSSSWVNHDLNYFLLLTSDVPSLALAKEFLPETLKISYNPIDISEPSLSKEEVSWMKNLLEKLEYIRSVEKEFDKK